MDFSLSCASLAAEVYNTVVGSSALTVGANCFVDFVPDKPDELVAVIGLAGYADRTQPVRGKEFQVVSRSKRVERAKNYITVISSQIDKTVNMVPGFCGRIKATQEDADRGYDKEGRIIFSQHFILTTV